VSAGKLRWRKLPQLQCLHPMIKQRKFPLWVSLPVCLFLCLSLCVPCTNHAVFDLQCLLSY
jgi:hypothetical protein